MKALIIIALAVFGYGIITVVHKSAAEKEEQRTQECNDHFLTWNHIQWEEHGCTELTGAKL